MRILIQFHLLIISSSKIKLEDQIMFGSKIYCNAKSAKVKKNAAETCEMFRAGAAPSNVNPIEHASNILCYSPKFRPANKIVNPSEKGVHDEQPTEAT